MKILVSNDDGIYAPGIWEMAVDLSYVAQVVVVAPDRERSGAGGSVTLHRPIRARKVRPLVPGIEAYSVEGTPGDSIILALRSLVGQSEVALVACGINEGPNLGDDALISGTVGAALQGYFYGIPSLAVSLVARQDYQFRTAARFARVLARKVLGGLAPERILLNVNVPNLPAADIKGVEATWLGRRTYADRVEGEGRSGNHSFWIRRGQPDWQKSRGSDVWATERGCISVTPLLSGTRNRSVYDTLRAIAPGLLAEFKAYAGKDEDRVTLSWD